MSQTTIHVRNQRGRWLFASAALAFSALSASCSISDGEGTAAACMDGTGDEDNDGYSNCEDPDCFAFEACRSAGLRGIDSGVDPRPTGGTGGNVGAGGSSGTVASAGGSSGGGGSSSFPDAGDSGLPTDPPDAGIEADAAVVLPCGGCGVGEECVDDVCTPLDDATGGTYTLKVLSGTMPYATFPGFMCVDYTCTGGGATQFWCICPPDPYVRVVRIRGDQETVVVVTNVVLTSIDPTFDVEPAVLELQPGDSLRFEMWDKNETIVDKQVFSCKPDLSILESGPLECTVQSGGLGTETHIIRTELGSTLQ